MGLMKMYKWMDLSYILTMEFMRVKLRMESSKDWVKWLGLTEAFMKVSGKMITITELEDLYMLMGMFMKENGPTVMLKEKENTLTVMELFMMVNGFKIFKKDTEKSLGQTELHTKVNINKGKKTVWVNFTGMMALILKECFLKITSMEKVYTTGLMVENMMEIG